MSTMGYVTTLTGAEDSANLNIDFEKQSYKVMEGGKQVAKDFSDIITFTRSTTGGRFNEKGLYEVMAANQPRFDYDPITKVLKGLLVEEQRTNFSTYSDTFTSTSWTKTNGRVELVGGSPMGKAYKYIPNTVDNSAHFLQKNYPTQSAGTYTATRCLKAGEIVKVRAQLFGSAAFAAADFDLTAGTVTVTAGTGTITPIGDGWYLCSVTGTWPNSENMTDRWYPLKGTQSSFPGDNIEGYYIASAQYEAGGSSSMYIPTEASFTSRSSTATYFDKNGVLKTAGVNVARTSAYIYDQSGKLVPVGLLLESVGTTNLIRLSTDLSINPWVRTPATVTVTEGGTAPDGSVAQMFTMYGTTGHNINQTLSSALTVGTTYTLSMWLRSPNWGNKQFQMAYYDGGVVANGGVVTPTAEWKRYEYTFTPTTVAASPQLRLIGFGNGVEGDKVEIFGPQLEVGMSSTSYTPSIAAFTGRASTATYLDSQGLLQTAASGVARSDTYKYDSSGVLRANGLLLETSGTNLLTNSEDFNSPNWGQSGTGVVPLVITSAAGSGPRGANTMTSIKRGDLWVRYMTKTFTVAAGNMTFSQYVRAGEIGKFYTVRVQSGGVGNRVDARFDLTTGATSVTVAGEVTAPKANMENMGGGLWRCTVSAASTVAWSLFTFAPADRLMTIDSTPVELSEVFVDAAQIESSPFASSYIPTTSAAATRASDVFTASTSTRAADVSSSVATTRTIDVANVNTLTPWYNATAGTLTSIVVPGARLGATRSVTVLDNGTQTNRIALFDITTGGNAAGRLTLNGTENSPTDLLNAFVQNVVTKTAISWSVPLGFVACVGGKTSSTTMPTSIPAVTTLRIGSSAVAGSFNGHIKAVGFYPLRLSNSQLQLLTE